MSMIMNEYTYYNDVKLWRAQLSFKCLGLRNSFCQAQGQGLATGQLLVEFTKH